MQPLKECRRHLVRDPAKEEDVADKETFQLRETPLVISREYQAWMCHTHPKAITRALG